MKKATELLEQLSEQLKYNSDTLSLEVYKYVKMRKELESTPITEEWLKAHGWEFRTSYYGNNEWMIGNNHYAITCFFGRLKDDGCCMDMHNNIPNGLNRVHKTFATLADLYDACELCEIELDK